MFIRQSYYTTAWNQINKAFVQEVSRQYFQHLKLKNQRFTVTFSHRPRLNRNNKKIYNVQPFWMSTKVKSPKPKTKSNRMWAVLKFWWLIWKLILLVLHLRVKCKNKTTMPVEIRKRQNKIFVKNIKWLTTNVLLKEVRKDRHLPNRFINGSQTAERNVSRHV